MASIRVLVTGSRTWLNRTWIWRELDRWHEHYPGMTLVHGAAPDGADAIADAWALDRGLVPERHPAQWDTGRGAGFARNAAMVASSIDLCLAFIDPCAKPGCNRPQPHDSHGASHCARLARKAGIDVREHRRGVPDA